MSSKTFNAGILTSGLFNSASKMISLSKKTFLTNGIFLQDVYDTPLYDQSQAH